MCVSFHQFHAHACCEANLVARMLAPAAHLLHAASGERAVGAPACGHIPAPKPFNSSPSCGYPSILISRGLSKPNIAAIHNSHNPVPLDGLSVADSAAAAAPEPPPLPDWHPKPASTPKPPLPEPPAPQRRRPRPRTYPLARVHQRVFQIDRWSSRRRVRPPDFHRDDDDDGDFNFSTAAPRSRRRPRPGRLCAKCTPARLGQRPSGARAELQRPGGPANRQRMAGSADGIACHTNTA